MRVLRAGTLVWSEPCAALPDARPDGRVRPRTQARTARADRRPDRARKHASDPARRARAEHDPAGGRIVLEEDSPEDVAEAEEDEDHGRDDQRDDADLRQEARA